MELDEIEISDSIDIFKDDLEEILATLTSVYHYTLSYDLFNQYKNLSNTVQPSPLTKQVKRTMGKVKAYIDEIEAQPESSQEDKEG